MQNEIISTEIKILESLLLVAELEGDVNEVDDLKEMIGNLKTEYEEVEKMDSLIDMFSEEDFNIGTI